MRQNPGRPHPGAPHALSGVLSARPRSPEPQPRSRRAQEGQTPQWRRTPAPYPTHDRLALSLPRSAPTLSLEGPAQLPPECPQGPRASRGPSPPPLFPSDDRRDCRSGPAGTACQPGSRVPLFRRCSERPPAPAAQLLPPGSHSWPKGSASARTDKQARSDFTEKQATSVIADKQATVNLYLTNTSPTD
jgi:hypothetical protein